MPFKNNSIIFFYFCPFLAHCAPARSRGSKNSRSAAKLPIKLFAKQPIQLGPILVVNVVPHYRHMQCACTYLRSLRGPSAFSSPDASLGLVGPQWTGWGDELIRFIINSHLPRSRAQHDLAPLALEGPIRAYCFMVFFFCCCCCLTESFMNKLIRLSPLQNGNLATDDRWIDQFCALNDVVDGWIV